MTKPVSEKTKLARKELVARSKDAKIVVEAQAMLGNDISVNEAILQSYMEETGCTEFRTSKQWADKGFKIKKGSTSFRLWGKPKKSTKKEQAESLKTGATESVEETYKFWPMCCLFNESQVEAFENKKAA